MHNFKLNLFLFNIKIVHLTHVWECKDMFRVQSFRFRVPGASVSVRPHISNLTPHIFFYHRASATQHRVIKGVTLLWYDG